jgi:fatty acid desaturase
MATDMIESPLARLTDEQIEALGKEFDAIHDEVFNDLGDRDRKYITSMIEMQRRLIVGGRVVLFASRSTPAWLAGTALLSMAKILENMEIGHNVMHGQWDWMNDPQINSSTWDWDSASTAEAWKHSHNYVHHTYTNIRGKDRDLGYEIMRIDPHQKWNPVYLFQPFYNLVLAALFEWGVASHDLDFEAIKRGEKNKAQIKREVKGMLGKARLQITKDYIAFPAVSAAIAGAVTLAIGRAQRTSRTERVKRRLGRGTPATATALDVARDTFVATLKADATANVIRNVWAYAIIFCGHFPDQTYTFSQEETEDESREHRGQPAVPRGQRQPRLPGRAPPLPRHAQHPLRRDRAAREGHLPALRAALQHRAVLQAARQRAAHHPAPGLPGRAPAREAGPLPRRGRRLPARAQRQRARTQRVDRPERLGARAELRRRARVDARRGVATLNAGGPAHWPARKAASGTAQTTRTSTALGPLSPASDWYSTRAPSGSER